MIKLNTKLAAVAGLSAALLTGCGGGGGGGGGSAGNGSGGGTQTIDSASVVGFLQQLMSSNGENSDPIDINSLTLAADDTADFTPII